MGITLRGIGVSPGIAIGPALPFGMPTLDIPQYTVEDKKAELARFEEAVEAVRKELTRDRERVAQEVGAHHADIFNAHLMVLDDITLRQEIEDRLETEGLNVEHFLGDLLGRYAKIMESLDDARFRERTRDLLDVGNRVLEKLLKREQRDLEHLDQPSIVVAHDLSPSDTAKIDLVNTLGIAMDVGGPTSHTAILTRAFEIPAIVGLKTIGEHARPGDTLVIDGTRGYAHIRPDETTLSDLVAEKKRQEEKRQKLLLAEKGKPSKTLDGHEVPTLANIELPVELSLCLKAEAQGIGLYRTEYLFLNHPSSPSEEEQFQAYAQVAEAVKPAPATLRTLDLGGDKFASHLPLADELNPQLGLRAIRFCLERPDIFKVQLRAMMRASVHGNVQIIFPLISGVDELLRVKAVVREVCADLERRGVPFKKDVELGSMIEVPSAVTVADVLAKESDFFSIGTNDLIQYSLAVDRVNEKIAHMYEPAHPAVIRMIRQTAQAAKEAKIPCAICGEMAGDPLFTELLLGLGINALSMSAVAIPVVRAEIMRTRMYVAKRLARKVLSLGSVSEIKALLNKRMKGRLTMDSYLFEFDRYREKERPEEG